jgi:dihydrofolate reductase
LGKVRAGGFGISIDGYGAGPNQDVDHPLGVDGGVATLRAYLRARLIDEIHLAVVPALLGVGEALFDEIDLPSLGYTLTESAATKRATHVVLAKVR